MAESRLTASGGTVLQNISAPDNDSDSDEGPNSRNSRCGVGFGGDKDDSFTLSSDDEPLCLASNQVCNDVMKLELKNALQFYIASRCITSFLSCVDVVGSKTLFLFNNIHHRVEVNVWVLDNLHILHSKPICND